MIKKFFLFMILLAVTTMSMADDNVADKLAGKWTGGYTQSNFTSEILYNIIKAPEKPGGTFTMDMNLDITQNQELTSIKMNIKIYVEGTWQSKGDTLTKKLTKVSSTLEDINGIAGLDTLMTIKDIAKESGMTVEQLKKSYAESIGEEFKGLITGGDANKTEVESTLVFAGNNEFLEIIPGTVPYRYYRKK